MSHVNSWGLGRHRVHVAARATLRRFAVVLSVIGAASCTSPSVSKEGGSPAGLSGFWSHADESVHGVQNSLRSARQVARQIGGEAAKGDYSEIIAVGHRLGGLGHDHATPADNAPVVSMLDSMIGSIDSLIHLAATSAELADAKGASDASVSKLSLRTQRVYHLLRAKEQATSVRVRATAIGFRAAR